MAESS